VLVILLVYPAKQAIAPIRCLSGGNGFWFEKLKNRNVIQACAEENIL
jgi:hypothetical protein